MELHLLGPLELVVGGRQIDLGGPRQRLVLSVLALNAGRVTPVDRLLDAVWGEALPSTARGQIQICISALRKLFAGAPGAAIHTRSPGYLLEVAPGVIDVDVFEEHAAAGRRHAAEGRLPEAVAELRAALALWHGPALAGIEAPAVLREVTRLHERQAEVLEERLRLDLALGRHQELTGELRSLVAEHPLHEHLHALLMLTLYRCGRQAEALEAGRQARALLAEEVGVDPGPELQEMERAILNRDPALDPAGTEPLTEEPAGPPPSPGPGAEAVPAPTGVATPRQLPPSIADFSGRAEELAEVLRALVAERDPYAVPVVVISGQGGVGKSSLAVRAAHELAADYPDGQLYSDLRGWDVDSGAHRQLARFLRALGVPGTAVPDDPMERAELYRSRLASRRVLVVLDGAADEEQIRPLLPGNPECAVVVTSRARLTGLSGAYGITVGPLAPHASAELLTEIVGAARTTAEPAATAELAALCDGLPLALRIAGARLASRPHWRIGELVDRLADENRRLDELTHKGLELRHTIAATYRGLPPEAQRLFRRCALVQAPDFPAWTAAALLGTGLTEAGDLLDDLVDDQVLEVRTMPEEHHRRYRMHELIRVFGLERLTAEEPVAEQRAAVERFLGGWLALSDAAHRQEYGGDYTSLHGTAPRWVPPDAELPEPLTDPLHWWERERRGLVPAIRQAAGQGFAEACWDLALTSVTLFELHGYFDDWQETAALAAGAAEAAGNRRGAAAAGYALGSLAMAQKRLPAAQEALTAALAGFTAIGDDHGRGLALRNLAFVSRLHGSTGLAAEQYAEALVAVRAAGDRVSEAHVLSSQARISIDDGDIAGARELLDEAVTICREAGCLRVEAQVTYRLAELHLGAGDLERARHCLHRTLRVVRDIGDRTGEAYALLTLGVLRHAEGRLEAARTTFDEALGLARERGERWVEGQSLFGLGEVARARGDDRSAAGHLTAAAGLFADLDAALWHAKSLIVLAEARAAAGEPGGSHLDLALDLLSEVDAGEAERWAARARDAAGRTRISPSGRPR